MQTCQGKTRAGAACRAPAGSGGLCFFHANPDSARTLGQIGGRKNRRSVGVDLQVPDNMTAADLSRGPLAGPPWVDRVPSEPLPVCRSDRTTCAVVWTSDAGPEVGF